MPNFSQQFKDFFETKIPFFTAHTQLPRLVINNKQIQFFIESGDMGPGPTYVTLDMAKSIAKKAVGLWIDKRPSRQNRCLEKE